METPRMVIDTSIIIDHLRAKDKSQTEFANLPREAELFVSILTVYELYSVELTPKKLRQIEDALEGLIELPLDRDIAIRAGEIYFDLQRRGKLIGPVDILIAATCLVEKQPLKTLNTKDFIRIYGIRLV